MNQTITGLDLTIGATRMGFQYGAGVLGPAAEFLTLNAIHSSLMDTQCNGPSPVYSIAMDVRRAEDDLKERHLLFGVVAYAAGRLRKETVRS